ncbi:AraC family transcriptional regulator [Flavihumibacter sp. R14]|nr:AraC family transcriptional regulator [Flavihumibacter soli]
MLITEILLILISGLGVLHGIILAIYLFGYATVRTTSNIILGTLLLILSFRVGKSVILEFAGDVNLILIFTGLSTLLLIGPLFHLYARSVLTRSFRLSKNDLIAFLPFIPALIFGLMVNRELIKQIPTEAFMVMFGLYYGHYLIYLLICYRLIRKARKQSGSTAAVQWLQLLVCGLAAIWVIYVLNILEEEVPYIVGPVLYSAIAYGISFVAIRNDYISRLSQVKYRSTPIKETEADELYRQIMKLVAEDGMFKNASLSLSSLARLLKVSPQKISMVINMNHPSNFNGFVNHFRVKQAQVLLADKAYMNYTIAFIAFETGFSSLSTFNTAFKKETGKTPSAYRSEIFEDKAV